MQERWEANTAFLNKVSTLNSKSMDHLLYGQVPASSAIPPTSSRWFESSIFEVALNMSASVEMLQTYLPRHWWFFTPAAVPICTQDGDIPYILYPRTVCKVRVVSLQI